MKKVLLTGASGGIGTEIKKEFEKNGYDVSSLSITEIDLADRESIDKYFVNNKTQFDVVIHCAGINNPKPLEEIDYSDIDKTLEINLLSFYRILYWVVPQMKKRKKGHILGISSIYSVISRARRLPYAISKHGMQGLIKTLSLELGGHNILINSISPGFIDTKLTSKNLSPKEIDVLRKKIALGRLGRPQEIAKVALFLCSSANTYLTGQNIIVDGGYVIGGFGE